MVQSTSVERAALVWEGSIETTGGFEAPMRSGGLSTRYWVLATACCLHRCIRPPADVNYFSWIP